MSDTVTENVHAEDPMPHGVTPPPRSEPTTVTADRWRPRVIWIATTAMLLMVTKGPVYRLRVDNEGLLGSRTGDFIDDRWVQSAFVVGALLVVGLCLPASRWLRSDPALVGVFSGFVLVVALSAAWSVDTARTLEQATMMAFGTAAALLAGASLGGVRIVTALAAAMHVGVAASVFARWRRWPLVLDRNGDLAGVYFNRNSLGAVAVAAAASAVVLLVIAIRRRRVVLVGPLAVLIVVDLSVWWLSGSLTPVFGLLVAAAVLGLFALCLPGEHAPVRRRIAMIVGIIAAGAAVAAVALRGAIATRLDRSPTLSGRTEIWDVVLQFVGERPLHGWGFFAVWTRPDIIDALDTQYGREVYEAHSGYLEVLLGVGVIGLVAMLAVVTVALVRVGAAAQARADVAGLFLFGTAAYAAAVNLGETYVGANLLPWTFLAVAAGWAVRELHEVAP